MHEVYRHPATSFIIESLLGTTTEANKYEIRFPNVRNTPETKFISQLKYVYCTVFHVFGSKICDVIKL